MYKGASFELSNGNATGIADYCVNGNGEGLWITMSYKGTRALYPCAPYNPRPGELTQVRGHIQFSAHTPQELSRKIRAMLRENGLTVRMVRGSAYGW